MCVRFGSRAIIFCTAVLSPPWAQESKQQKPETGKRPTTRLFCHCGLNIYDSASQRAGKCMIAYYVIVIKL